MAKKNQSFDLGKYQSKREKQVKIKKEKPLKIKKEKPIKMKSEKAIKIKQDNMLSRVKKTKKDKNVDLGFSSVLDDKKKRFKRRKILFIALAALLVIGLVVIGIIWFQNRDETDVFDDKLVDSLYISAYPLKTTYVIGDTKADYTGLKLGVLLKNGTNQYIEYTEETAQDFTFRGFDASAYCEDQTIIVTYRGFDCEFHISIKEKPQATPVLKNIVVETLPKTEYTVKDAALSTRNGIIRLEYKDGSVSRVNLTNKNVDGWKEAMADAKERGPSETPYTYTLTVWYVETGILAETTYDITIANPVQPEE